jgi:hypothetical protein
MLREVAERKLSPARGTATHTMGGTKKRPATLSSSNDNRPVDRKRLCSNVTGRERESRYVHKKLLQDIEKLVSKSQREMNVIADEDLNEISKILKMKKASTTPPSANEVAPEKNVGTVFIIKRRRKSSPNRKGKNCCNYLPTYFAFSV